MPETKCLRIGYLSGPAEAERFLSEMRSDTSDYFGTNYMKQFLQLAGDIDAEAYVVTWHKGGSYRRRVGRFTFDNRNLREPSGILFYLDRSVWHLGVLARMIAFRPDVMIVTGNQDFWWLLSPLRLLGTRFIASYHCVIWRKFGRRKVSSRVLSRLNAWLVLRSMPAIVSTSEDITDQVHSLLGRSDRVIAHLPSYGPAQFEGIVAVRDLPEWPFETIFMGRIEENKGVFDLLEVAARLERDRPGEYRFHVCGDGTQAERLVEEIADRDLGSVVTYHGYCGPERIREVMSRCHLSVVPTRSDFEAGFEMTCCEATLSGRPLVASATCPALHYLRGASIEVPPDDVAELRSTIERLGLDRAEYRRLAAACGPLEAQFLDPARSWTAAMRRALNAAGYGSAS